MKKLMALLLCVLLLAGVTACGKTTTDGSDKDYSEILTNALSKTDLEKFPLIVTAEDSGAALILKELGLKNEDMRKFSMSVSTNILYAHVIAIILPAEGKTAEIKSALEDYIKAQQVAQENYNPVQHEITKSAQIKTTNTGEIIIVMKKDASAIISEIISGLK